MKMRKLGIVIALSAAATLGLAGHASADGHEDTLCPVLDDFAAGAAENDGEPLTSTFEGAAKTCKQSNQSVGLQPSPLLCGVAKGLDARPGGDLGQPTLGSDTVGAVNDGLADNVPENPVVGFQKCGGAGGGGKDPSPSGGGGGAAPQVLAANATADGGLPRTGGELFAGAGFAVMSLGALIRRFLP